MKNSILVCALSVWSLFVTAQPQSGTRYPLNTDEVFVLKVDVLKNLMQAKDPCLDAKGKSTLYNVEVKQVLFCPPNPVFDSAALLKLRFVIASQHLSNTIKPGESYLLTAHFSSSKDYLVVSKLLDPLFEKGAVFYHNNGFFSGLLYCNQSQKNEFSNRIASLR